MKNQADLQVLYHGFCFDGVVCAAIFSRFYQERVKPDATVAFRGMAHGKADPFGADHEATFWAEVNAVMDFRYSPSPRLQWWCDHHHTAFLEQAHQHHFEADRSGQKCFDPAAPSCAGLLARWLGKAHGFQASGLDELVAWADLIDSAAFDSPAQAVELAEPALRLAMVLESVPPDALVEAMIGGLQRGTIAEVHNLPGVQQQLEQVLRRHEQTIEVFRRRLEVSRGVASVDLVEDGTEGFNKFIPYFLQPDLRYTVVLTSSERRAKVSVGSNPWQRPDPLHNLGELCQRFGGGGHPVVGAVTLPAGEEAAARAAFEEITEILKT